MIHKAWGLINSSPEDLKLYFNELNINYSHLYRTPKGQYRRTSKQNRKTQTLFPVIVEGVNVMTNISSMERQEELIVFCFLSKAELLNSNLTPLAISETNPMMSVKYALRHIEDKPFLFKYREPSLLEIVATVNKPSVLQNLQTLFYKIQNTEVRNDISAAIYAYLGSNLTASALNRKLNSTLLKDELTRVLKTVEARALKEAVQQVQSGADVDEVSKMTGVDSFDINFITHR